MNPQISREQLASRLILATQRISYRKLSDRTGINHETVRRYMNGNFSDPSLQYLAGICLGFDVNANWLLVGAGPKHGTTPDGMVSHLATCPELAEQLRLTLVNQVTRSQQHERVSNRIIDVK